MLEESLKGNIIVAMDTGSGKTHVAVLRILAELERMEPDKLIWFLAPTVALCIQQNEYFQLHFPSILTKLLVGADGVDRWTEQRQWDAILEDVKIVVSSYQVLLDALTHGFVRMERLSLIIFDEAHNCLNKAPGAKIMTSFYHPNRSKTPLPHILGLSASPVMRSDKKSLSKIEETLDAICRTPKVHQADLRLQVKLPILSIIYYIPEVECIATKTITSLGVVIQGLNIFEDPCVLNLKSSDDEKSQRELAKILRNHKTYSQVQLRSIYNTSHGILFPELGSWAADYYISAMVTKYLKALMTTDAFVVQDTADAQEVYIAKALKKVELSPPLTIPDRVSNKAAKLIEILEQQDRPFSAIIFVKERATVLVLAHLLSRHPLIKERFKIGSMVGTSSHSNRTRKISDIVDLSEQKDALSDFKRGKIDILIATSVLEEGIDVRACNLVICFSKPANLKSFIQRRGRARQQDSKLILLDALGDKVIDWHELERNMRQIYEDDMRDVQHICEIEVADENSGDDRTLLIESTGARLDLDNAVAHLHHFCAVLTVKEFVDSRPDFVYSSDLGSKYVEARVILPLSVPETLRVHKSRGSWLSEKGAAKDAAFEAYVALYKGGLVNDNLLPLMVHDEVIDELTSKPVDTRASLLQVKERLDPWREIAIAWREAENDPNIVRTSVMSLGDLDIDLCLPIEPPAIPPLKLYWDSKTEFSVEFTNDTKTGTSKALMSQALNDTYLLLSGVFSRRFPILSRRMIVQFVLHRASPSLNLDCFPVQLDGTFQNTGFIRKSADLVQPYIFEKWLLSKPPINEVQHPDVDYLHTPVGVPHLALTLVSRRTDFLHKVEDQSSTRSSKKYSYVLPASACVQDAMPFQFSQFGMMIPSITHHIEIQLVVDRLSRTILKALEISDPSVIQTAITASTYSGVLNYQSLEFLGDSILKLCTSVQLMAEHPLWPEGYLSAMKDRIVSNSRLSRAAVELGLDEYIITRRFTGRKWRPNYVENYPETTEQKTREMSSKTLADVVEALIGACMVDGGIPKALKSLQIFLPELQWLPLETQRNSLYQRAPENLSLPITLHPVEKIIAYTFTKKSLLIEAMTHPSYSIGTQSLERLEFLGDAILDNIVVTAMWSHELELTHFQMHLLRSALVNADFLAFLCMEMSIEQDVSNLIQGQDREIHAIHTSRRVPLVNFLRHSSIAVSIYQKQALSRHLELREQILAVIDRGDKFPWALLSRLDARKFFSDMIESLLGAVWIDSGSIDVCTRVVERMGLLKYMRRILRDGVRTMHPKEELGIAAGNAKVKYVLRNQKIGGDADEDVPEGRLEYMCQVFVGGEEIVDVAGGVRKEEIQATAAEKAIEILRERERDGAKDEQTEVVGGTDKMDRS
ncbi:hypothetical protein EYC84_010961 [Monilinia fructicola]|uniref:Dicer-like protein 2 n=1 Tax=Monilinia fructicola TaxID=38448 RepID=A0A5M9J9J5_MONFR|nr:hypothetical protein EYC84_010961 [Monilinia fructicola]